MLSLRVARTSDHLRSRLAGCSTEGLTYEVSAQGKAQSGFSACDTILGAVTNGTLLDTTQDLLEAPDGLPCFRVQPEVRRQLQPSPGDEVRLQSRLVRVVQDPGEVREVRRGGEDDRRREAARRERREVRREVELGERVADVLERHRVVRGERVLVEDVQVKARVRDLLLELDDGLRQLLGALGAILGLLTAVVIVTPWRPWPGRPHPEPLLMDD